MKVGLYFRFILFHLFAFSLLRLAFLFTFMTDADLQMGAIGKAMVLGLRFDLRLALILLLPLLVLGWGRFCPLYGKKQEKRWRRFYQILAVLWISFYFVDIGHYSYLQTRVNGTILDNLRNPDIALTMMWQSYPVVWVFLALVVLLLAYSYYLRHWVFTHYRIPFVLCPPALSVAAFVILLPVGLYGSLSQYPLRWSQAFSTPNNFHAQLSLNPLLYFFETFTFEEDKDGFDVERTKALLPVMGPYLGLPEAQGEKLNFARNVEVPPATQPWNVVVIVMESLALSKTSLMNNHLKPTPALESIASEGLWFSNYYSPAEGTARNVFSLMTAIPDVTKMKSSSRNPLVVDQRLIINSFKDHRKMYFLGGSANWANIRGIFTHNVSDIEMYEEGTFERARTDVWGISDLDLFLEAHEVLNKAPSDKPFFAVIQTASFHRPYTIPSENMGFQSKTETPENLQKAGFYSVEQYNSLRFSDHSLGKFFELAKKSPYYKNTIFVITGDHGLPDDNGANVSAGSHRWNLEKYHVPLVFHAPQLWTESREDQRMTGHLDLMTSVAAVAGQSHLNTTLGRSLFDANFDNERYSFIYDVYSEMGVYTLLSSEFLFRFDDLKKGQLYQYKSETPDVNVKEQFPEVYDRMSAVAEGYWQSARYLLFNNKKTAPEGAAKD